MKKYVLIMILLFTITVKAETITISSNTSISEQTIEEKRDKASNIIIDKGNLKIENSKLRKEGNGELNSFNNSAIFVNDNSKLNTSHLEISTSGTYANGIYLKSNSECSIDNSTIITDKEYSVGIINDGGKAILNNTTIETREHDSSGIYSIGGKTEISNSNIKSLSVDSPLLQVAANIEIYDSKLLANSSEGIVAIPGANITIDKTTLDSNNMMAKDGSFRNILLYNPNSELFKGEINFNAKNSNLTARLGNTFNIMNAVVKINLYNNEISNSNGIFLKTYNDELVDINNNVELNLDKQIIKGSIELVKEDILNLTLDKSEFNGSINANNIAQEVNITLSKDSKLTLTGNSYVTSLTNGDYENSNINLNGYKLYIKGEEISKDNIKRLNDNNDNLYVVLGLIVGIILGFSVVYLLFRTRFFKKK